MRKMAEVKVKANIGKKPPTKIAGNKRPPKEGAGKKKETGGLTPGLGSFGGSSVGLEPTKKNIFLEKKPKEK